MKQCRYIFKSSLNFCRSMVIRVFVKKIYCQWIKKKWKWVRKCYKYIRKSLPKNNEKYRRLYFRMVIESCTYEIPRKCYYILKELNASVQHNIMQMVVNGMKCTSAGPFFVFLCDPYMDYNDFKWNVINSLESIWNITLCNFWKNVSLLFKKLLFIYNFNYRWIVEQFVYF